MASAEVIRQLKRAFHEDDASEVQRMLQEHSELRAMVNEPVGPFDSPAILNAKSRAMVDVLLGAGADINAKSRWWAGGFGLLHVADPELASYAIGRGAVVDAHAAARLGLISELERLLGADPSLVHSRGGDGQMPLHFAQTREVADLLLRSGADIDARDIDHESTAVQYMVRDRQPLAQYLVQEQGAASDILMAVALGDLDLVETHLRARPESIRMRVNNEHFPMCGDSRAGGTIYQWALGWHQSAHEIARDFKREEIAGLLRARSSDEVLLLAAGWAGDADEARRLREKDSGLLQRLSPEERRMLAHAARNNQLSAVRAFLAGGFPVDTRGQHQGTALHWAAFHGNKEMTRTLLASGASLEVVDADFSATPLGWAVHGSEQGWHVRTGDFAGCVELLLSAGASVDAWNGSGSEPVRMLLRRNR
ncbi:MAG: ankyrin repeat domain-containing protein [Verrucomicrobia bacterium]|nr:ankyrin repeat domain-containing protein [Verrucomicrobiota bacterium]